MDQRISGFRLVRCLPFVRFVCTVLLGVFWLNRQYSVRKGAERPTARRFVASSTRVACACLFRSSYRRSLEAFSRCRVAHNSTLTPAAASQAILSLSGSCRGWLRPHLFSREAERPLTAKLFARSTEIACSWFLVASPCRRIFATKRVILCSRSPPTVVGWLGDLRPVYEHDGMKANLEDSLERELGKLGLLGK